MSKDEVCVKLHGEGMEDSGRRTNVVLLADPFPFTGRSLSLGIINFQCICVWVIVLFC